MCRGQAASVGGGEPEAYLARLRAGYPQGTRARFVRPDEVAELFWCVCLQAATSFTGFGKPSNFTTRTLTGESLPYNSGLEAGRDAHSVRCSVSSRARSSRAWV